MPAAVTAQVARMDDIIAFSELRDFIDQPVKTYSSGMYVRLGFAVAVHVDPDVLLIDEVLSVGDEEFSAKCVAKIQEMKYRGVTLVFVTHQLGQVRDLCDRALWLDHGEAVGVREGLKEERTGCINRIRGVLAEFGLGALNRRLVLIGAPL